MEIQRFYLGCLAHASYLVYDEGEAAVIDPQRDVQLYIEAAEQLGVHIRWVIETHLHADFVSGHVELGRRTGATICISGEAGAEFPHRDVWDGEELPLGAAKLRVLATPGHTTESICIVAVNSDGATPAVFTGDTLFIGDVGRPDLSPTYTPQQLAGMLFDSLHGKLLTLPVETVVYPAHGAGSLCGKSMSADASSTIGKESRLNYALQPATKEEFVSLLTAELPPRPEYFQDEVARNRAGAVGVDELESVRGLTPDEVIALQAAGGVVLDTRPSDQFGAAHVPGSVHIGLRGQFASWAARLLGLHRTMVLVGEDDAAVEESRVRLARVGIETIAGALAGGILAWVDAGKPVDSVAQVSARDAARELQDGVALVDVREAHERSARGAVPGGGWIPLLELAPRAKELDRARPVMVMCQGGYRSSIGASLLKAAGFSEVINVVGGFDAWAIAFPEVGKSTVCSAG